MKRICMLLAVLAGLASPRLYAVDHATITRDEGFGTLVLSPTGEYFAATIPAPDRTVVVVMRRADRKVTASHSLGRDNHVGDLVWVNDERVLLSVSQRFGRLDQPLATGELFALSVSGGRMDNLVGYRVEERAGTRIQSKRAEAVFARYVGRIPGDDRNVVISVEAFGQDTSPRAEKLDVYSGRRTPLARAPIRNARYFVDNAGVVRFAVGTEVDNTSRLLHRAPGASDWTVVNDERESRRIEWPIGFSVDDGTAYLTSERPEGPDTVVALDTASGRRREIVSNPRVDPSSVIRAFTGNAPVGVVFMDGKPVLSFFDPASAEARLLGGVQQSFEGALVTVKSVTRDGKLALIEVRSDRNPGDYYLLDTQRKNADFVISRREWIDPAMMSPTEPVSFAARDGLRIQGLLTVPKGKARKDLPLVVMPHGGPFGIRDTWSFDDDVQILAGRGYAVLQVDYRGSGGYGRAFQQAGARQWGGAMQDDLTDATRWATAQGIADGRRICIYGASYGAYASLMGAAKEPSLYRCAAGLVGVYDLPMLQRRTGSASRRLGQWSNEWVGDDVDALAAVSPNRIAERIRVPVFLSAGGEDQVAPVEHTRLMERAIRNAGGRVDAQYFPTEGHGYYVEANRVAFYERLLSFLDTHIGDAATIAP